MGKGRIAALAAWAAVLAATVAITRPALIEATPTNSAATAGAAAGASAGAPGASVLDEAGDRLFPAGKAVYQQNCAACHDAGIAPAPSIVILRYLSPQAIYHALTAGVMRIQGSQLTDAQKVDVAQFLSSRKLEAAHDAPPARMCRGAAARFDRAEPPIFSNWGLDAMGTHLIPTDTAGLTRANVGRLKLKWSFGFPDAERLRSQPMLAGAAVFLGTHTGAVYALDRETGCVRWTFAADAEVRTGIVVAPWQAGDAKAAPLLYFGDVRGQIYALDAFTGRLAWKITADTHPATVITAAPSLYQGTLYIAVSSLEEASATAPGYQCCSFRGSVLAVDAATGKQRWRTWTVPDPAGPVPGTALLGPSGGAVWNSPNIDPGRGQLTIGTADNYTQPASAMSDSVVALDLADGRVRWSRQLVHGDAWNVGCMIPGHPSCPANPGPDFGFGAGTMRVRANDGRELIVAGQKGGMVHAVDPATGALVWEARVGRGGMAGGVNFGMAASAGVIFAPVSDMFDGRQTERPARPGVHALDADDGRELWYTPFPGDCGARPGEDANPACKGGASGALSATPELVMVGADDGHVRILDAATGKVLWDYDTRPGLKTVNGVPAHGGAIGGAVTPLAYHGKLFVASGYGFAGKLPGNALLVFEAE